ncbi:hypothetical protein SLS58_003018 [Diplodia intermedia]|uniref:Uncharacterized protein n=1 Tax=Diplodia intermedia TaxID=856260 RepID=A0ABR3TXH3_9PEZI
MDSFESKDAAEWLSISPKNDDPQSSAHEPSSSHSSRNQLRFRTHNPTIGNAEVFRTMPASSPGPALHQSRIKRDVLIDLDPLEEQPKPKAPFACSNPFASLASEGSTSSAESTPIRDRHGTNSPVVLRTPVHTVPLGKQEVSGGNIANETLIQKGHSRASSSHFDGLTGLDPSFFVPSSAGLHPSSSESVMTEGPPGQTLISLLDEDVPPLKRQEDEAWFKAQSGKGTAPSVSQPPSGDTSRSHFEQLGQLIYPIGTPATPSYRDRTSPPDRGSPRGGPRNRGGPRSRGGQRVRGGRHGSHSHAPQRSTYSYSGSEDTSGTVFKQPRGQASTRGQGYSPRGSRGPRGRGSYAQSHSRPAGQNAPFVRDSMRENSHASSDQSEEISLAARVADAIESGEKSYSLAVYHDNAATTRWRKTKMLSGKTISLPKNLNLVGK